MKKTSEQTNECSECGKKTGSQNGQHFKNDRVFCDECMKPRSNAAKARAVTQACERAAHLLGDVARDQDILAAIRKASPETAKDIEATTYEWTDASETFLRGGGFGSGPPQTFREGAIVVVSWKDGETRRGIVLKNRPDEVTLRFEDDDDQEEFGYERGHGGWFEFNDSQTAVQINQE